MPNIKKYDYAQICSDRGIKYIKEENPYIFIEDLYGFTHRMDRLNFAKGSVSGFKSVQGDKTAYFKAVFHDKFGCQEHLFRFGNFEYVKSLEYTSVVCNLHGEYRTKPNWLLSRGHHCDICAEEKRSERKFLGIDGFIRKSLSVHGNLYDYSKVNYNGAREYVEIICPKHGLFKQIPYYHLAGNGCPECGKVTGGYSATDYAKVCPDGSNVYLLKIYDKEEMFYKIGISKNIKNRVQDIKGQARYNVDIVSYNYHEDAEYVFYVENILNYLFDQFKYKPKQNFQGFTECFSYVDGCEFDCLLSEIH